MKITCKEYNPGMDVNVSNKLNAFFTNYRASTYKKGEIFLRAGDNPNSVFYLKEGRVKKYAISHKGEEVVVNIFRPISFFPMDLVFTGEENSYYYEAITDCKVWKAPPEEVKEFLKSEPDVLYDLLSRVFKGTGGLEKRMMTLMAGSAYARLLTELIIQTKRFGRKITIKDNKRNDSREVMINEIEMASQTGLTRETVSRAMKVLKKKGLVTFSQNHLIVISLEDLEKELVEVD